MKSPECIKVHSGREERIMLIKAGVDISRLERRTRNGLKIVAAVLSQYGEEIIITSTYEGNHGPGSLHYANQAFDIRTPDKETTALSIELMTMLGSDFDVVAEDTHIHIEYDPS